MYKVNVEAPGISKEILETVINPEVSRLILQVHNHFQNDLHRVFQTQRKERNKNFRPEDLLQKPFPHIHLDQDWKVASPPPEFLRRGVDIGDVDPTNPRQLLTSLTHPLADGVQIDFDDGFAPSSSNVIIGHYNIIQYLRGKSALCISPGRSFKGPSPAYTPVTPPVLSPSHTPASSPLLILRPRGWNIPDQTFHIHLLPSSPPIHLYGFIVDLLLYLYHNYKELSHLYNGHCLLYLAKTESSEEAELMNQIFSFCEELLHLRRGFIRVILILESFPLLFDLDKSIYALRERCVSLNFGVLDYTANAISRQLSSLPRLCPSRSSISSPLLLFVKHAKEYMIECGRRRGLICTGGMFSFMTHEVSSKKRAMCEDEEVYDLLKESIKRELSLGFDGVLIYDNTLTEKAKEVVLKAIDTVYATRIPPLLSKEFFSSLVTLPPLDKTTDDEDEVSLVKALKENLQVIFHYMYNWLNYSGQFVRLVPHMDGRFLHLVEDSASCEISRSLLKNWISHPCPPFENLQYTPTVVPGSVLNRSSEEEKSLEEHYGVFLALLEGLGNEMREEIRNTAPMGECTEEEEEKIKKALEHCLRCVFEKENCFVTNYMMKNGFLPSSSPTWEADLALAPHADTAKL